jgi:hypothetical protein
LHETNSLSIVGLCCFFAKLPIPSSWCISSSFHIRSTRCYCPLRLPAPPTISPNSINEASDCQDAHSNLRAEEIQSAVKFRRRPRFRKRRPFTGISSQPRYLPTFFHHIRSIQSRRFFDRPLRLRSPGNHSEQSHRVFPNPSAINTETPDRVGFGPTLSATQPRSFAQTGISCGC